MAFSPLPDGSENVFPESNKMKVSISTTDNERSQDILSSPVVSDFEQHIRDGVSSDNLGSVTAALVLGNNVIWSKSFGYANISLKSLANPESIYRVGSITKTFTAVALIQLAESGILNLDDPVEDSLPEVSGLIGYKKYEPITFRKLASHTAGLIKEPELEYAASGPIGNWESRIIESISATRFQSKPGTEFSYSNIGFGILGLAISRAANCPFMELVNENIFKPLEMKSSGFILTEEMTKHLADGYVIDKSGSANPEFPALEHKGRGYKVPNGGIYSNVGDLGKFIAMLTGCSPAQILSPENRTEMQKIQTPETGESGYGLGVRILSDEKSNIIGHGGSVAGYNAAMSICPASRAGVILLRNYTRSALNLKQVANEFLQDLVHRF